jgi:Xaa-Pro aminopeptidase
MFRRSLALCVLLLACTAGRALDRQPIEAYRARRLHLADELKGGVAVVFAAEQPLLDLTPYRQDEDFYYLTGWNQPGAALLVESAQSPRPYREILFLPTRNRHLELYTGVKLDASDPNAPRLTGVDEVRQVTELPGVLNELAQKDPSAVREIASQPDLPKARALAIWLATTLGSDRAAPLTDIGALTMPLRAKKDAGEIALLRAASNASVQAQLAMIKAVHPGAKERTVAGVLIEKLMEEGCERPSYAPIVGSGANSTSLHYSDNSGTMQDGDVVVVDAAGEYSMYASDITRTMPVNGHFTTRQREVYNLVLEAQRAAIDAFVPGKSRINDPRHKYPDSLDSIAFNYMNAHGKDLHGAPIGKYFIHGIGHLVGIDVHDPWDYSKPIEDGMVFTIEPGIYLPEEKLGVRIEDTFYVNNDGKLIDLTEALPKRPEEVEKIMRASESSQSAANSAR